MSKFKVGDKVICNDATGTEGQLTHGKIYEVLGIRGDDIYVVGRSLSWSADRFDLAPGQVLGFPPSPGAPTVEYKPQRVTFRPGEIMYVDGDPQGFVPPNPSLAMRHNDGKPPLSYILYWPYAQNEKAMVALMGEKKYARFNYKKGAPISQSIDCALRHLQKFLNGEDIDPESGRHHLAHAAWNIDRGLDEMLDPATKDRLDDRYKAGKQA